MEVLQHRALGRLKVFTDAIDDVICFHSVLTHFLGNSLVTGVSLAAGPGFHPEQQMVKFFDLVWISFIS
jgi:hypothetical protein